jgi:hypothetical protein
MDFAQIPFVVSMTYPGSTVYTVESVDDLYVQEVVFDRPLDLWKTPHLYVCIDNVNYEYCSRVLVSKVLSRSHNTLIIEKKFQKISIELLNPIKALCIRICKPVLQQLWKEIEFSTTFANTRGVNLYLHGPHYPELIVFTTNNPIFTPKLRHNSGTLIPHHFFVINKSLNEYAISLNLLIRTSADIRNYFRHRNRFQFRGKYKSDDLRLDFKCRSVYDPRGTQRSVYSPHGGTPAGGVHTSLGTKIMITAVRYVS